MNVSQLLSSPGLFTNNRPVATAILLSAVLAICLISITQVRFENDISKSFSSESTYSQDYSDLIASLGFAPRQVVVLAESSTPFNVADFETLRDLAFELELTDSVSSVFSLASVQFPNTHSRFPDAPLLPVPLDARQIQERLTALKEAGLRVPISLDQKSALFVVSLTGGLSEDAFLSTLQQLRNTTDQYGGADLRYSFTGEDLIGPEMVRALQHDLIINNLVGCLLAFVLAMILFGNFRLVMIAVLPALMAALMAMATFAFLDFPITVLNVVIPILILVLALADSVHLTLHLRDENSELTGKQRIERTVSTVGPACALTAVTTAIAFAAIGTSGNQQLKELAAVGTVSVLAAYIVVIVAFVLLAHFLGTGEAQQTHQQRFIIPAGLNDWIQNNTKVIYAICGVTVCVSVIGLANLKPWFNLDENLPTDSTVRITNQKIAGEFGGIYRIWSELDVSGENALSTRKGWERLVSLTHAIESAAPNYPVISLATLARWRGQPDKMLSPEQLENLPDEIVVQLLSRDNEIARVITIAPEAMLDQSAYQLHKSIEENAVLSGATRNIGLPVIMAHESVSVILQLCLGLGMACLISVVLVAAFYRWPMLAAILLVPNILPLAVAAASLTLTHNSELTPTAMLALTVAFGIAIDDSIHLVNRFLVEKKQGGSIDQALQNSIQKTGKAMLVTTILICAGMLVTMFSSFETIRLFGEMLILTFVTAFLADILLLPCLLRAVASKS